MQKKEVAKKMSKYGVIVHRSDVKLVCKVGFWKAVAYRLAKLFGKKVEIYKNISDSELIQKAIDSWSVSGGRVLLNGEFYLDKPITLFCWKGDN